MLEFVRLFKSEVVKPQAKLPNDPNTVEIV